LVGRILSPALSSIYQWKRRETNRELDAAMDE
jgi:hypothetical protein